MITGRIITLLTDFGTDDTFVGIMKGVILGIAPGVRLVDLTHSVPPQNVEAAAYHLATAVPYFPDGTIHVAVVDPGVGTSRAALAVATERAIFLAPDNGLLSKVLAITPARRIVKIENARWLLPHISATFHGRDVFAPAAAHLANGVPLEELGPETTTMTLFPTDSPRRDDSGRLWGRIQHIDRFGNLITDVPAAMLVWTDVRIDLRDTPIIGLSRTYADVMPGTPLALIGSHGFLEIAVRNGSAANALGARVGDPVKIAPLTH